MWPDSGLTLVCDCDWFPVSVRSAGNGSRRTLPYSTGFRRDLLRPPPIRFTNSCSTGFYRPRLAWLRVGATGRRSFGPPGRSGAAPGPGHGERRYRGLSVATRARGGSGTRMPPPGSDDRALLTVVVARFVSLAIWCLSHISSFHREKVEFYTISHFLMG